MVEEELLKAYISMTTSIKENKLLKSFTFNEVIIMNTLYQNNGSLEFKELVIKTKMMKSLVNRTISSMVKKEYVMTNVPTSDKRKLIISINKGNKIYEQEHLRMIQTLSFIRNKYSEEDLNKFILMMDEISSIVYTKGV